jgi:NhaP-type Na+/H+ or K+/H+ antiporter
MPAHGDTLRSHGSLPFQDSWEAAREWTRRHTRRELTFMFLVTLVAILGFGLVVYGFVEAMGTLKATQLPPYWSVRPF